MRWPLDNLKITQGFHGINKDFDYEHWGTDLGANQGVDIKAPESGVVTAVNSGWTGKSPNNYFGGNYVKMTGDSGYSYYMGHMVSASATVNQRVTEGQVIGKVGMTGQATGPHVHFEMYLNGAAVDAEKHLKGEPMAKITKEQEQVLSILATGSYPGKDYNYQWTGKEATQENLDRMLQQWSGLAASAGLQKTVKDQLVEIADLKGQLKSASDAAPTDADKKLQTIKDALGIK